MGLSTHCLARGRYELAGELHAIGTEWYEREVVKKREPGDTAKDRKYYRLVLADYKAHLAEFPLLVATRSRFLEELKKHPEGIDRSKFKDEVRHQGSSAFGVICNQLARGGWIRQEKDGKRFNLYFEKQAPVSDDVFIKTELPTAADLDSKAKNERPIATLMVEVQPKKRSGCLSSVLGLIILGLSLIWLVNER